MKPIPLLSAKFLIVAATLAATIVSSPALAGGGHRGHGGHGGHGHWRSSFSLHLGAPLFWPYYAYAPAYYPQHVVVAPAPQVIYVEQAQQPIAPPVAQQYWYYCTSPEGYYPNVQQCASGWQKVLPQPAR